MPTPDDNAVLTGVDSTFYTEDDDKDSTTILEVWINMKGEREAAYGLVKDTGFADRSVQPVHLGPKTNQMRRRDIPGSWFQVRINTQGSNDTWRFHCDVKLTFSDGSTYPKSFPATTDLDQDHTQANFNL